MIKVTNLSKKFMMGTQEVVALDGVDIEIDDGEIAAIVGASGSGKSTLLNILGCLDVPSSGTYHLSDTEINSLSDDRLADIRNHKIGFIFQTYNLLPKLTSLANVELALRYRHVSNRKQLAAEALARVGLSDRLTHRPPELSGGQQQRVGIARAIVKNPDIILADEPTGNLDSQSGAEIMSILKDLNQDGITVVIVTHELEIAAQIKRVITLSDGRVVDN